MKIVIEYAGKTYESAETDDISQEAAFDDIYKQFEDMNKLSVDLANGGKLILGRDALQMAAVMVMP